MINLTDILTKPVLSLNNSRCEGIVKTGIFNQNFKKLKSLVLFDNNENSEDKVLLTSSIFATGENAIIIKDDEYLTPYQASLLSLDKPSPINSDVYTFLGKHIGIVSDVVLTDKFLVHSIKTNEKEILLSDIISCGENTIIVQDENNKVKISSLKRHKSNCVNIKNLKLNENQKVYILSPSKQNNLTKIENLTPQNLTKSQLKTHNFQAIDNKIYPQNDVNNFAKNNFDENDNINKFNQNNINFQHDNEEIQSLSINETMQNSLTDNAFLQGDLIAPDLKPKMPSNLNENLNLSDNSTLAENGGVGQNNALETQQNLKPKIVYSLTETPSGPGLVISNYEFLIGRKLEQNIYSQNNELIAKKNTKITADTIIKARLFNKTRDLVKFSH